MSRKSRGLFQRNGDERLNEVKMQLCEALRRIGIRNGWTHREMAQILGTSEACVSRVVHRRLNQLTLNQLFTYLARAEPQFEILISI